LVHGALEKLTVNGPLTDAAIDETKKAPSELYCDASVGYTVCGIHPMGISISLRQ
jgi:hypothetical protein